MTQMMIIKRNDELYSEVPRHWIRVQLVPSKTTTDLMFLQLAGVCIYLMYSARADIDTDVAVIINDIYIYVYIYIFGVYTSVHVCVISRHLGPLLLRWFNFNHNMDRLIYPLQIRVEITYTFPNCNGVTVEVMALISNLIPHFTGHVIVYPCQG